MNLEACGNSSQIRQFIGSPSLISILFLLLYISIQISLFVVKKKWDRLNHRHYFFSQTSRESDWNDKGHR